MKLSNVLIVVVDGLRASALGAYGNTTYPTPALDRFAAESLLLDECIAPASRLSHVYDALWHALHSAWAAAQHSHGTQHAVGPPSLPRMFRELGYRTSLVTDEPLLPHFAAASEFDVCRLNAEASAREVPPTRASDLADTRFARLFALAAEETFNDEARNHEVPSEANFQGTPPRLVWLHAQGMYGPWDAPLELQVPLLDEHEPTPLEIWLPPQLQLTPADDPDLSFRHATAYAAQVIAFDACWQWLLTLLAEEHSARPWLVMLLGARGYPLGEHGQIGGPDARLPAEQLHVPWLVRFPDGRGSLARSNQLVTHLDVLPTLRDSIGIPIMNLEPQAIDLSKPTIGPYDGASLLPLTGPKAVPWRESLLACDSTEDDFAVRTHSWCLRGQRLSGGSARDETADARLELFVCPDDRWEANDVARLCPKIVEQLIERIPQT
ncbi:MAG: sulfatase-like hydrolase/transferase [Pirellulales bacterium]|nr:sulfatase-like hydrolase/transferase [Pirellulales bacterium]